ncbi:synaptosomal-associated protein 47-like [Limulus polyphemus]|uniref:Synaptosomal-associated protein 47 n=1 Tax=Limulus polyphemus TaxID=6850 RepID=A0ABM1TLI8_LIMPO|nr:synaptosomal-associated protein 47-like [Limulus polyphemus]
MATSGKIESIYSRPKVTTNDSVGLVHQTKCSYFYPAEGRWANGNMFLSKDKIVFSLEKTGSGTEDKILQLLLRNITEVKKRSSSLIFPAIIVQVGAMPHWFASFPNRDITFNLLELFWKEYLLCKTIYHDVESKKWESENEAQSLGQEMMEIMYDSHATLQAAALTLHQQGDQLSNASRVVGDINENLSVSERFLGMLSSVMNMIKVPRSHSVPEMTDKEKSFKFSASFCISTHNMAEYQKLIQGIIDIRSSGIRLIRSDGQISHHLRGKYISSIKVLTPWEISISHSSDPSRSKIQVFIVVCPRLAEALKKLQLYYRQKISLDGEDTTLHDRNLLLSPDSKKSGVSRKERSTQFHKSEGRSGEEMLVKEKQMINEEEADEINQMISSLHSLALEVGQEQCAQLEKIDKLIGYVDRTDDRMKEDIKKNKEITRQHLNMEMFTRFTEIVKILTFFKFSFLRK